MEEENPHKTDEEQQDNSSVQDEPEEPGPQPEPMPDPDKPLSEKEPGRPENKRPLNPTEAFVHEMVESGKKPFEAPKPNKGGEENPEKIEELTNRIRDRIQRKG